jgi:hypothetical protein
MKHLLIIGCCSALMMLYGISCRSGSMGEPQSGPNNYRPVPANREDSLLKEVLDVHDYAMARMMKLSRYKTRAQQEYDSLLRAGSKGQMARGWKQAEEQLSRAEQLMQDWMAQFKLDSMQNDPEKRVIYLEGEKRKVQAMKEAIDASLSLADSLQLK